VIVDLEDLLDAGGLKEWGGDPLLHGKHDSLVGLNPNGGRSELRRERKGEKGEKGKEEKEEKRKKKKERKNEILKHGI